LSRLVENVAVVFTLIEPSVDFEYPCRARPFVSGVVLSVYTAPRRSVEVGFVVGELSPCRLKF
jgi:hypothetical protein